MKLTPDLTTEPDRDRCFAMGLAGDNPVDREGGDNGAGLLRGAAVITTGVEALGHRMWVDQEFGEQVARAIFAAGKQGLKARFTHPGLSADGLGSYLGRFKRPAGARSWKALVDGETIRADLHFAESAHNSPDGDLAGYVMDLAEEDPGAFGTSIVFRHDYGAEEKHRSNNKDEGGNFRSPDPKNVNHYEHARLSELRAIDAVDSPAANPDGLFHRQATAHDAEQLIGYVLGVEDDVPTDGAFSEFVSPQRVAGFVSKFLERRGLELVPKQNTGAGMKVATGSAAANNSAGESLGNAVEGAGLNSGAVESTGEASGTLATDAGNEPPVVDQRAEIKTYMAAFGDAQGAKWFAEGKPFADCQQAFTEQLKAENAELKTRLSGVQLGEAEPLSGGGSDPESGRKPGETKEKTSLQLKLGDRLGRYAASLKMPTPSAN